MASSNHHSIMATTLVACVLVAVAILPTTAVFGQYSPEEAAVLQNMLPEVHNRMDLMFRSFDHNGDHHITMHDIQQQPHVLQRHLPGVSGQQFASFLDVADRNTDGRVSREEFGHAMTAGLQNTRHVGGHVENLMRFRQQGDDAHTKAEKIKAEKIKTEKIKAEKEKKGTTKSASESASTGSSSEELPPVDTSQDECIMCQYLMDRYYKAVLYSHVVPGLGTPRPDRGIGGAPDTNVLHNEMNAVDAGRLPAIPHISPEAMADTEEQVEEELEFVETESRQPPYLPRGGPTPMAVPQVYPMSTFHESFNNLQGKATQGERGYFNSMEYRIYNEVYRVVDIAHDEVCERSMPQMYYGYCKTVTQKQNVITSLLAREFKPLDICNRIGMCTHENYVYTDLKHTPPLAGETAQTEPEYPLHPVSDDGHLSSNKKAGHQSNKKSNSDPAKSKAL
jgi:EF-hand domain pair